MTELEQVFRTEYGRVIATLIRRFGDIDLAEDAVGEAVVAAVRLWPDSGVPPNPGGWLTTTATRRAIDRIRREALREGKEVSAMRSAGRLDEPDPWSGTDDASDGDGSVPDDRLRLIYTCCHPALAPAARVALTLRLLGGLEVPDIARAFLVAETTMAQRITRAKRKIADARIPYRVPSAPELAARTSAVLAVLYLIFNEGYLAGSGELAIRRELCAEAIRLTRVLTALLPEDDEARGLLALMLLLEARRPARVGLDPDGEQVLVPLDEQDRTAWDRALIAEGHALVRQCLANGRPGRYQVLAAINAVHTDAATFADTDWSQIVRLYDLLVQLDPSPIVELNRAVAIGELDGPEVALARIDRLALDGYHAWHATRAELLRRLRRREEATAAYDAAIAAASNPAEQTFLRRRRDALTG